MDADRSPPRHDHSLHGPDDVGPAWLWGRLSGDPSLTTPRLLFAIVVTVMLVVVIAHVYETLFMFRYPGARSPLEGAAGAHATSAELDALQRDVDPHFLYNRPEQPVAADRNEAARAMAFVEALAATYRYVVDTRGRALVSLIDELGALERQRVLAEIRFADSVRFRRCRGPWRRAAGTFRRSSFRSCSRTRSNTTPSTDTLRSTCESSVRGSDLLVSNRFRPRLAPIQSTRLGLRNLDERMRLAVGRPLQWGIAGDRFVVFAAGAG